MRVLLKISGEALAGGEPSGLDYVMLDEVCDKIKELINHNVEV
jgi:uridylate kinase